MAALLLLPAAGAIAATSTEVFRCTSGDGSVEFRQGPCDARAEQSTLSVEDRPTGWVPPAAPTGQSEKRPKASKETKRTASATKSSEAQARQCWEKRQKLEEVNWRLRQGYKAKQGMMLKRKREYYEEYLEEFCER
jgi:hypothetical protein